MDSKKVIEKLVKIAENQQKIINKLAQAAGLAPGGGGAQPMGGASDSWVDIGPHVAQMLARMPQAKGVGVQSAQAGQQSGAVDGKLKVHMNMLGDPKLDAVMKQLSAGLAGQTVGGVKLSQNPQDIKFIAET